MDSITASPFTVFLGDIIFITFLFVYSFDAYRALDFWITLHDLFFILVDDDVLLCKLTLG